MLRGMIVVSCVFMVRFEMKFVSMSTLIVVLVSVEVMNTLRVLRMASCVENRACFTGYLPACVHRMLTSAPKAWPYMAVIIFSFHYRVTSCEHCRQRAWTMRCCASSDDAGGC